ncbi:MAG: hypothetical protein SOW25_06980 [Helicobacter sp.]|nr:hypothetical protein [Helicobacteraceae bacterium]MDY3114052.1 hypothetical protein [Helicobacter sp.]
MKFYKYKKGGILLPLILLIILGSLFMILSIKTESKNVDLKRLETKLLWLDLHTISVKEKIKERLKMQGLNNDFLELNFTIGDYSYICIIKKLEKAQLYPQYEFYFIDIYGKFLDSKKEFLQEFSTRRNFILNL